MLYLIFNIKLACRGIILADYLHVKMRPGLLLLKSANQQSVVQISLFQHYYINNQ